jgi:hypothetical protein
MEMIPPFVIMPFLTFADAIFLREVSRGCRRHFKLAVAMAVVENRLLDCLCSDVEDSARILKAMKDEGFLLVGNKIWTVLFDHLSTMYKPILVSVVKSTSKSTQTHKERPVAMRHSLSKIATVSRHRCSSARLQQLGEHAVITSTYAASCRKNSIKYVNGKMTIEIDDRNILRQMFTLVPVYSACGISIEIQACESAGFQLLRSSFMDTCSWRTSPAALAIKKTIHIFEGGMVQDCGRPCHIHDAKHYRQRLNPAIRLLIRNTKIATIPSYFKFSRG